MPARLPLFRTLSALLTLSAFSACAQDAATRIQTTDTPSQPAPSAVVTRGPYLQSASPHGIVIRWRTAVPVIGRVSLGEAPARLLREITGTAPTGEHELAIDGLKPSTTYFYRIGVAGSADSSDEPVAFRTPPAPGATDPARIWVLGDAGMADANQRSVRDAFAQWSEGRLPDFVLQLGDNAYNDGTDAEFQRALFEMYPEWLKRVPFWSCLGNHETDQSTEFVDTYPYFQQHTFPTRGECGGVPSGAEHFYSFDYGNVHVISLDSTTADRSPTGRMATWLQADLAATRADWVLCIFHHPPYTRGSHDSDHEKPLVEMRENILPLLEAGGVDLVLSGHSHCYERSTLLNGHYGPSKSFSAANQLNAGDGREGGGGPYVKPAGRVSHGGTVYVVAGSAGKLSGGQLNHPAHLISLNRLGSLVIDVQGKRLDARFLRETGAIDDHFTILKQ
ncbi:purple acid phosphatase family protein [Nibricoccus sp. IMCC34717]|uniref:purple acid phosphatase family protein n=1 Tax=Nibricoccus sp. IMCC34717 TaxID=3034021 RepID=UPI00385155D4